MIVLLLPFAIEVILIGIPLLSCTTHSTLNLEVNLQPGPGDCSVSVQLHRHLYSKQRQDVTSQLGSEASSAGRTTS